MIAAAAGVLAALLIAGCTTIPEGLDGDVTNSWSMIGNPTAFKPAAGTCHEDLEPTGPMETYRPVACTALHLSETVALGTFTGPTAAQTHVPEPGSAAETTAYQDCSTKISAFVGGPWRSGRITVNVVLPSQAGWSGGARWYRCDITEADVNSSRQISRKGTMARGLTGAAPLRLGCFNPQIAADDVEKMNAVSCTKKHHAEFVGLWNAPAMAYAKLRSDQKRTAKGCRTAIAKFAKVPDNSDIQYRSGWISYNPTEEQWDRGERGVQCFLWLSGRTLTRSMKGAGTGGRGLHIQYQ
jgi:hypothetical protein